MVPEELKDIYREAKKQAMQIFNKAAVGDVSELYHEQLKSQMS